MQEGVRAGYTCDRVPEAQLGDIVLDYNEKLDQAIGRLHEEGRYRTFIDIERRKGHFPHAVWNRPDGTQQELKQSGLYLPCTLCAGLLKAAFLEEAIMFPLKNPFRRRFQNLPHTSFRVRGTDIEVGIWQSERDPSSFRFKLSRFGDNGKRFTALKKATQRVDHMFLTEIALSLSLALGTLCFVIPKL